MKAELESAPLRDATKQMGSPANLFNNLPPLSWYSMTLKRVNYFINQRLNDEPKSSEVASLLLISTLSLLVSTLLKMLGLKPNCSLILRQGERIEKF